MTVELTGTGRHGVRPPATRPGSLGRLWHARRPWWRLGGTLGLTGIALTLLFGAFVTVCGVGQWHADVTDRNLARQLQASGVHTDATLVQIWIRYSYRYRYSETVVVTLPTATGEVRAALVGRTQSAGRGRCGACYLGTTVGGQLKVVYSPDRPSEVMASADVTQRAASPLPPGGPLLAAGGAVITLVGIAAWWWPVRPREGHRSSEQRRSGVRDRDLPRRRSAPDILAR
ncbi:MAG: hypothetical protein BGO38_16015 [Cellulomonas sp. 73-145]|nr:MAG: hypothetical protein BGO38_16015 [Cellulomonas sp. 73-145]